MPRAAHRISILKNVSLIADYPHPPIPSPQCREQRNQTKNRVSCFLAVAPLSLGRGAGGEGASASLNNR